MSKDLLQPTATIVAALIARGGNDIYAGGFDIKGEFVRVYKELEKAKKELEDSSDATAKVGSLNLP